MPATNKGAVTTKVKDLFAYDTLPLIIVLLLIAITILILVILYHKKNTVPPKIQVIVPDNKPSIKSKYIALIDQLIAKVNNNKITNRKAYQELSLLIRNFIFEMTSIKVQNYTLSDIKTLNMPFLTTLVEEYYAPEFSYDSKGNILDSINKTKEVIVKWQ